MLKVLYLPINTVEQAQVGMYDAWKALGVELHIFDFYLKWTRNKNVTAICNEFVEIVRNLQPDLVQMQLQMTNIIDSATLHRARAACNKPTIFINWSGDVRNHAAPEIISVSGAVDYTFISSTGQIPLYEKAGCKNVRYWQIGYDPKYFFPKKQTSFEYHVSFAGNAYPHGTFADAGLRLNILRSLKKRYGNKFGLFGHGYHANEFGKTQYASGLDLNNAYNKSACVLSISNYNDISHYFSDRLLACMASGRPTVCYRFPKYETYFTNKSDILMANSLEDIHNLIDYCVTHPEEANLIGRNGNARMQAEHTHRSRVAELVQMLGLMDKL